MTYTFNSYVTRYHLSIWGVFPSDEISHLFAYISDITRVQIMYTKSPLMEEKCFSMLLTLLFKYAYVFRSTIFVRVFVAKYRKYFISCTIASMNFRYYFGIYCMLLQTPSEERRLLAK